MLIIDPDPVCSDQHLTPIRSRRSRRREAEILYISRRIFLREGYSGTSMSMIAAGLGGSKATLYSYFPSKAELFAAVVQSECQRIRIGLPHLTDVEGDDLLSRLHEFGMRFAMVSLSEEVIGITRLIIEEAKRLPDLPRVYEASWGEPIRATLVAFLDRQLKRQSLVSVDRAEAAELFCQSCLGSHVLERLLNLRTGVDFAAINKNVSRAVRSLARANGFEVATSSRPVAS